MHRISTLLFLCLILNIPFFPVEGWLTKPLEAEAAAEPAPSIQEASASTLGWDSYRDPVTGMEFVLVKGGCFQMGDTFGEGEPDELPVHEICLNDFYMGRYEVTVGQFRKFVQATGYQTEAEKGEGEALRVWTGKGWKKDPSRNWQNAGFPQDDRHPAINLSIEDARALADWLSQKTGERFRLPTEAEWEYAARSGGKKQSWAGTSDQAQLGEYAWYEENSGGTSHPVGGKKPNDLGLHDMSGNAWEWVADPYGEKYYHESPKENPRGPGRGASLLRGGSWFHEPWFLRAADRVSARPSWPIAGRGFRLVLSAGPAGKESQ